MKKRIIIHIIVLILMIQVLPVLTDIQAASEAEIVTCYIQGGELFATVSLPDGTDISRLSVNAAVEGELLESKDKLLVRNCDTDNPVSYMFLLDISKSMSTYYVNAEQLIKSFVDNSQGNVSFCLATFGDKFEIEGEYSADNTDMLIDKITNMKYPAKNTNLYESIIDAIDYYQSRDRKNSESYHIIIISDGIEDMENGKQPSDVIEKINSSYPVTIHTYGMHRGYIDARSFTALKVLEGFSDLTSGVYATNSRNADAILEYCNNLIAVRFDLPLRLAIPFDVTFRFIDANIITMPYFEPSKQGVNIIESFRPSIITGSPDITEHPDVTRTPDITEKPDVTGSPDITENPDISKNPDITKSTDSEDVSNNNSDKNQKTPIKILGLDIVRFILIAVMVILLVLILIYKFVKKVKQQIVTDTSGGILMTIQIISGKFSGKDNEYRLNTELIIGRNKECDIYFKDKDVSERNARVFLKDNMIFIEDLDSTNGTAIGGMKIHAPNRLRSGDEISIGNVRFLFKF